MKKVFDFSKKKGDPAPKEEKKNNLKKGKTKIIIKYDVGFNNALYIRGQGGDLSWEQGKMMKNVGPDEWVWECEVPFKNCEFKVLINDQWYEVGDNHSLKCGGAIQYTPRF